MRFRPRDRQNDSHGRDRKHHRDRRQRTSIPVGRAREWLSSYVYGNITVLSAAIAVGPEQIRHGAAVGAVLATGFLTFLAHVLAHVVSHGIGQGVDESEHPASREVVREVLATARPIATAALIPAALYLVAWLGWVPPIWVQISAIVILAVRIGFVGLFMQRFSGVALTLRALWAGVALALVALAIGIVKVLLTH